MATTRNSNTTAKSATRRGPGRPSNASRQAAVQSHTSQMVGIALAAASAAVQAVFQTMESQGQVQGGVTSIGIPQGNTGGQTSRSDSGSSRSDSTTGSSNTGSGNTRSTSGSNSSGEARTRKAPGRKVQEGSAMSRTKAFYAENLKASSPLNRADFVEAAHKKFGYTKQTANTYVSNIEKEGGYQLVSRGGNVGNRTASRRPRASQSKQQGQQAQAS